MNRTDVLLNNIVESLRNNPGVKAAWLAGSRGRGTADEFSDIDIWIAMDDAAISLVVDDPLAFVHQIVPTMMHILAPYIAPVGGSFANTWVPVDDEFVQVDWYFVPMSTATRQVDTALVIGDVAIEDTNDLPRIPAEQAVNNAHDSLKDSLQMIGNVVKHARRGDFWRVADHARHVENCLLKARSLLTSGNLPDFVAANESILPEPPPVTVAEVQELALMLLNEAERLDAQVGQSLGASIAAMRTVVENWKTSGWKPTEEYYRTLPRRYMGAGMLITDTENNILLVETAYKDSFEIPGGVVESGESPREAARREVLEELGIDLTPGRLLVVDTRSQSAPKGDAIMLLFDGGVLGSADDIRVDGDEILRIHFVPERDLEDRCERNMATRLRAAIKARQHQRTIEIIDGKVLD